jgi:predicted nucleic acid-binding protein
VESRLNRNGARLSNLESGTLGIAVCSLKTWRRRSPPSGPTVSVSVPRVTADTNVLISRLIFAGTPRQIAESGAIHLAVSDRIKAAYRSHGGDPTDNRILECAVASQSG